MYLSFKIGVSDRSNLFTVQVQAEEIRIITEGEDKPDRNLQVFSQPQTREGLSYHFHYMAMFLRNPRLVTLQKSTLFSLNGVEGYAPCRFGRTSGLSWTFFKITGLERVGEFQSFNILKISSFRLWENDECCWVRCFFFILLEYGWDIWKGYPRILWSQHSIHRRRKWFFITIN